MDADWHWAPLLDPEWRRTYGALESLLRELAELEHSCPCEVCHELSHRRALTVAMAWVALGAEHQQRWMEGYGLLPEGAVLRDALVTVGPEAVSELEAMRGA
jgi:hypothetical protein